MKELKQMYAVINDRGRQIQVSEGETVLVDLREETEGTELSFDTVLAVRTEKGLVSGTPHVEGACVTAEVLGLTKGDKLFPTHFRRRKASKTRIGHRQKYTKIKIKEICYGA